VCEANESGCAIDCGDPACANELDDDGDRSIDYPNDPGCSDASSSDEAPQCQDGRDNDRQTGIDFDGGASLDLDGNGFVDAAFNPDMPAVGAPDPQCIGKPERSSEGVSCGLGAEATLFLTLLYGGRMLIHKRSRRVS
jgi:hypothetical protein